MFKIRIDIGGLTFLSIATFSTREEEAAEIERLRKYVAPGSSFWSVPDPGIAAVRAEREACASIAAEQRKKDAADGADSDNPNDWMIGAGAIAASKQIEDSIRSRG